MTVRELVFALVPAGWTGEQALRAVNVLNQAVDAIWMVHGDAMAHVLFEPPEPVDPLDHDGDDDLPF